MTALRRAFAWIAEHPRAILALLAVGIAIRVGWTASGNLAFSDTELRNAALHWAQTGWIGDAYRIGSGPTAHVGALPPVLSGSAFGMFGADSVASALVLTAFSAAAIVATAFVLNRLFARLGTPAVWRGAAVLLVAVVPLHLEVEARSLRVYENGLAALLLAVLLLAAVRLEQIGRVTFRDAVGLSGLTALLLALSPTVALAAVGVLTVLALRRCGWRDRLVAATVLAVVLVASAAPWALRNRAVMGEAVWTRGNFGLEFALGTHAGAVAPDDPGGVYRARLAQIHPHGSDAPYRAMVAAGGELPYARALGAQTWGWVRANPLSAARIWVRHLREFWFPRPWLWFHTAPVSSLTLIRAAIVDVIALLALSGLVLALYRRHVAFVYLLPPVLLLPLPYLLTQPLIRYRYVIASLLIFLAADCVARLVKRR